VHLPLSLRLRRIIPDLTDWVFGPRVQASIWKGGGSVIIFYSAYTCTDLYATEIKHTFLNCFDLWVTAWTLKEKPRYWQRHEEEYLLAPEASDMQE
jgi:hypothetical protein